MLEVGVKAPDFELPDQNGKYTDYRIMQEKSSIIFLSKDNTAGCTKQACGFPRDILSLLKRCSYSWSQ